MRNYQLPFLWTNLLRFLWTNKLPFFSLMGNWERITVISLNRFFLLLIEEVSKCRFEQKLGCPRNLLEKDRTRFFSHSKLEKKHTWAENPKCEMKLDCSDLESWFFKIVLIQLHRIYFWIKKIYLQCKYSCKSYGGYYAMINWKVLMSTINQVSIRDSIR